MIERQLLGNSHKHPQLPGVTWHHLEGAQSGEIEEPCVDRGTTLCCKEAQEVVAGMGYSLWQTWEGGVKCEKR